MIYSCSNPPLSELNYEYKGSISQIGDSSYLSKTIGGFLSINNIIYASDVFNSRCIMFDTLFQVRSIFGKAGRGPGEFITPSQIASFKDSIYVYDSSQNKYLVFIQTGNFVREFYIKDSRPTNKFIITPNGQIVLSNPFAAKPLSVYDLNGNKKFEFGRIIEKWKSKNANISNYRELELVNDSLIIAILRYQPIIEVYDLNGKLLIEKDISEQQQIKDRINSIDFNKQGFPIIANSTTVDRNILYILTLKELDSEWWSTGLLGIHVDSKNIVPITQTTLHRPKANKCYYGKMLAHNGHLYAFEVLKNEIDIFKMN